MTEKSSMPPSIQNSSVFNESEDHSPRNQNSPYISSESVEKLFGIIQLYLNTLKSGHLQLANLKTNNEANQEKQRIFHNNCLYAFNTEILIPLNEDMKILETAVLKISKNILKMNHEKTQMSSALKSLVQVFPSSII